MTRVTHKIDLQRLVVKVSQRGLSANLQQRVGTVWVRVGQPILERVFDSHAPGNGNISVHRLTIDLGGVRLEGLEDAIRDRLPNALHDALASLPSQPKTREESDAPSAPGSVLSSSQASGVERLAGSAIEEDSSRRVTLPRDHDRLPLPSVDSDHDTIPIDLTDRDAKALRVFLERGTLPWWYRPPDRGLGSVLVATIGNCSAFLAWLITAIRTSSRELRRLVLQFTDAELEAVALGLARNLCQLSLPEPDVVTYSTCLEASDRVELWTRKLCSIVNSESTRLEETIKDAHTSATTSCTGANEDERIDSQCHVDIRGADSRHPVDVSDVTSLPSTHSMDSLADMLTDNTTGEEPLLQKPQRHLSTLVDSEWSVENAGLVLLCPFLPELFTRCQFVEQGQFVSSESQATAVGALQYLISGEHEYPEHQLILNKIVCGIDLELPLPRSMTMSSEVLAECDNLLRSVIEHWSAVGNTSVSVLQTTFLQRTGLVQKLESEYVVHVIRMGLDVLVDRLPWPFSVFRASWMDRLLRVEW